MATGRVQKGGAEGKAGTDLGRGKEPKLAFSEEELRALAHRIALWNLCGTKQKEEDLKLPLGEEAQSTDLILLVRLFAEEEDGSEREYMAEIVTASLLPDFRTAWEAAQSAVRRRVKRIRARRAEG